MLPSLRYDDQQLNADHKANCDVIFCEHEGVHHPQQAAQILQCKKIAIQLCILVSLIILTFVSSPSIAHAEGVLTLNKEGVNIPNPIDVGTTVEFRITWSCSSLTADCGSVTISDTLPSTLEYLSHATPSGYTSDYNDTTNTITWHNDAFNDGDSAEALVTARVAYDAPADTPISNTATGSISDPAGGTDPITLSTPVETTTQAPTNQWSVHKRIVLPANGQPAVGEDVVYQVQLCANSAIGNVSLFEAQLIDTFPSGATVISHSGGTVAGDTVTWNLGDLQIADVGGGCVSRRIVLQYPDASFSIGDSVTNALIGRHRNGEIGTGVNHELFPAFTEATIAKSGAAWPVGPTAQAEYRLSMDTSNSNTPINNLILQDDLPADMQLVFVQAGRWLTNTVKADIEYSTDNGTNWTLLRTVNGSQRPTFHVFKNNPDFPDNVTNIRWVFFDDTSGTRVNQVQGGFRLSTQPIIRMIPRGDGAGNFSDATTQNCAQTIYDNFDGSTGNQNTCRETTLSESPVAVYDFNKSRSPGGNRRPGDELQFTLRSTLRRESSAPMVNPTVVDLLPPEMELITWDEVRFVNIPDDNRVMPNLEIIPNFTAEGHTLLRWTWASTIPTNSIQFDGSPGVANPWTVAPAVSGTGYRDAYAEIRYTARIVAGTTPGRYTNVANLFTENSTPNCQDDLSTDTQDLDGDGDTTEQICGNDLRIRVLESAVMFSEKWIDGYPGLDHIDPDNPTVVPNLLCPDDGEGFTRYPCVARGLPAGDFTYKLRLTNYGNVPLTDYVVYDVMPYINDTGVSQTLGNLGRGSQWTPALKGPMIPDDAYTAGVGAVVAYSRSNNPCRPEMSRNSDESGWQNTCDDDWTTDTTGWGELEWAAVRAFRINVPFTTPDTWQPREELVFRFQMIIPAGSPPSTDTYQSIAWNTIAHRATNATSGGRLNTAEPRKVGIIMPVVDQYPALPDRGDLPNVYGTKIVNSLGITGATHIITDDLFFGTRVDGEADGIPTIGADGDDTSNALDSGNVVNDEDGITFVTPFVEGQIATIELNAHVDAAVNGTGSAFYGVWIDFDGDGTFNGESEFHTGTLSDGTTTLTVSVPSAITDTVYSRFRIAADQDEVGQQDDFVGVAATGEVEDYVHMNLGNRVWLDNSGDSNTGTASNGVQDGDEAGIDSVIVQLLDGSGNAILVNGQPLTTTTTNGGFYHFKGLAPNDYRVRVVSGNFTSGGVLERYVSTSDTANASNPNSDVDGDDNGVGTATDTVTSGIVTLSPNSEPDTAVDTNDANGNLTIDFGFVLQDWGDLPDGYDTTSLNNGAVHTIVPGVYLGAGVDAETSGQPHEDAVGDDDANSNLPATITDDEDGVAWTPLIPGETATITVTASTAGFLHAWIDWDDDGSFDSNAFGDDEQLADNMAVSAGVNSFNVAVPPESNVGNYAYTRFRFTTVDESALPGGNLTANGATSVGEVEDYKIPLIEYDYGDLPSNYPTTNANNAAYHVVLDGSDVFLGATVDTETDGVPSADAMGDDSNEATDDEDGVEFLTGLHAGQTAQIQVTANAPGYLSMFIDFDGDGILDVVTLDSATSNDGTPPAAGTLGDVHLDAAGVYVLTIDVPANLSPTTDGITPVRVRFTQNAGEGGNAPDGLADSGEIEDYVLMSLGNLVWLDNGAGNGPDTNTANNGIVDGTEAGIANVTVQLYPTGADPLSTTALATTTTDSNGNYLFAGLPPSDYFVHIPANEFAEGNTLNGFFSSGVTVSTPDANSTDNDDNGIDPPALADYLTDGVSSGVVTLALSDEPNTADDGDGANGNRTVDFGFIQYDKGDLPDSYATHTLTNNGPRHVILDGFFLGSQVDAEADGQPSVGADGDDTGDGNDDEDGVTFTGPVAGFPPFVVGQPATLTVESSTAGVLNAFIDWDNNGSLDNVTLNSGNAVNPGGTLSDYALVAGTNTIVIDVPTTVVQQGVTGTVYSRFRLTLNAGEATTPTGVAPSGEVEDYVVETVELFSLGNRVWHDLDADGLISGATITDTEPGLDGVTVNLLDVNDNVLDTTTTSDGGYYRFDHLLAGDYRVEIAASNFMTGNVLHNMVSSPPTEADPDSDVDSNDNGLESTTPITSPVTVGIRSELVTLSSANGGEPTAEVDLTSSDPGQAINDDYSNLTVDFGLYEPVSVGNRVWHDLNRNGRQDPNEPGVENVRVTLYDTATQSPVLDEAGNVLSLVTDATGYYLFEGLLPGQYYVVVDFNTFPSTEWQVTLRNTATVSHTLDSDARPNDGHTGNTAVLISGQEDLTLDTGLWVPVRVGSIVWFDHNKNGLRDNDEEGVPNVFVTLHNETSGSDSPLAGMFTYSSGEYLFDNLPPDNYFVIFHLWSLPEGLLPTLRQVGDDISIDSDADSITGQTPPTGFLPSNTEMLTLDAGLSSLVTVGDLVWFDDNHNGVQDENEAGVPGVQVKLFTALGEDLDRSTTTDADGHYLFTGLRPGDYFVQFVPDTIPDGYRLSPRNQGGDDEQDSDAQPRFDVPIPDPDKIGATPATGILFANESDLTLDMGLWTTVRVGNRVWFDNNANGIQDDETDEPGVEGVTVTLFNADGTPAHDANRQPVEPQITDANGNYLFDTLEPGDYYVEFKLDSVPTGYIATQPENVLFGLAPGVVAEEIDSDADRETGVTPSTGFIASRSEDFKLDFGIIAPVSVGNRVWFDNNANGLQDDGEAGVPDVQVSIFKLSGEPAVDIEANAVVSQTTNADGNYLFENLPPDAYYVEFNLNTLPVGYRVTHANEGNVDADTGIDSAVDSDADPSNGRTHSTPLIPSFEADLKLDMGLVQLQEVRVGDRVWYDNNGNGVQDPDEGGAEGVTVHLFLADGSPALDRNGTVVAAQTTDSNGNYLFANLLPGDYLAEFDLDTLPAGYQAINPDRVDPIQGPDDSIDSDADPGTGRTSTTGALAEGQENLTLDLGLERLAGIRVGNLVWFDNNGNGLQESTEPGVAGVVVSLFNADGTPANNLTGIPLPPQTTDENGRYLFTDLPAGSYYVTFDLATLPDGYSLTLPNQGNDDHEDSDVEPPSDGSTTGQSGLTQSLVAGQQDLSLDMGIVAPVQVGDTVWFDNNGNGFQDDGTDGNTAGVGVAGVTVRLFTLDGSPAVDMNGNAVDAQVTDANGNYLFTNLRPSNYHVVFDLATIPAGYDVTIPNAIDPVVGFVQETDSDANPSTGRSENTGPLQSNEQDLTLDMGLVQLADVRVGDRVWIDSNINGLQDDDEPGLAGVTANLVVVAGGVDTPAVDLNGNAVAAQVTDENGNYLFTGLPSGDYAVLFDLSSLPAGYQLTAQNAGDDTLDSDAASDTGRTSNTGPLSQGTTLQDLTLDMGVYQLASVGGKVWVDAEADGLQDPFAPETTLSSVTVSLLDGSGAPVLDDSGNPVIAVTDANGNYLFENLLPGGYMVEFTLPDGYTLSGNNVGNDDSLDSDVDAATNRTSVITLASGDASLTWDVGLYQPATLGDRIWDDLDADGLQEDGEPGLIGIVVTIYDETGTPIMDASGQPLSDTTDANGNYLFTDLMPGDYIIRCVPPSGYVTTLANQDPEGTPNDAVDSDADPTTCQTPVIELTMGENDLDWDAGFYMTTGLGDFVWHDVNADGVQDNGENGIANVVVSLLDVSGNVITHTTTDETGFYAFVDLAPGDYAVAFTTPAGYAMSPPGVGSNGAADSDADPSTGQTGYVTLVNGESNLHVDAGFYRPASLGDVVWYDANENGVQNADETGAPGAPNAIGVPGVTVTLFDVDNNQLDTTVTDGQGFYLFDGLVPGSYYVQFTLPNDYAVSPANAGIDDLFDSDADLVTLASHTTTLSSGQHDPTLDMGIYLPSQDPAALGDRVWLDSNQDGLQDEGEPGVQGVMVTLYEVAGQGNTLIATTQTDLNGIYQFAGLVAGDYVVEFALPTEYRFSPQDVGESNLIDSDVNPDTGRTEAITLAQGESDQRWDAGIYTEIETATICDFVWFDANQNGLRDPGEDGVPGVAVELYDTNDVVVATIQTDEQGDYCFTGLIPGEYYVTYVLPEKFVVTKEDAGDAPEPTDGQPDQGTDVTVGDGVGIDTDINTDINTDSDVDAETATSEPIQVEGGEEEVNGISVGVHLGVDLTTQQPIQPATLGNRVWEDSDRNGIQDFGELGVEGVVVKLYGEDGALIATTVTDLSGSYLFPNLTAGDYYIEFVPPEGLVLTSIFVDASGDGSGIDNDSNANPDTGRTSPVTIITGATDLTVDAGVAEPIDPTALPVTDEPVRGRTGAQPQSKLFLPVVMK
ncbi:MAG: SdrD B-like domain-containing protein [Chloroflexota bacterium]